MVTIRTYEGDLEGVLKKEFKKGVDLVVEGGLVLI